MLIIIKLMKIMMQTLMVMMLFIKSKILFLLIYIISIIYNNFKLAKKFKKKKIKLFNNKIKCLWLKLNNFRD